MLICISGLFQACSNPHLSVHTDYLSHKNLASYHVGTPDPRLDNPPIGQRLIVTWSIPRMYLYYEDPHLVVTIRFRNREEIEETIYIHRMHGTYVYDLLNEDYIEKRGMLSYKVDIIAQGCLLDQWRHQIWADLIHLQDQENPETNSTDDDCNEEIEDEDEFS